MNSSDSLVSLLESGSLELLDLDGIVESQPASCDYNYGFTSVELLGVMAASGVTTGKFCSGLALPNTRWPKIVKVSDDARDMANEVTSPEIEMFARLTNVYPQAAPWTLKTISDLVKISGWSVKELSIVCASAENSVDKWLNEAQPTMDSQSAILIDLIYRLIDTYKIPKADILKMGLGMRANRNAHHIHEMEDGTWQSKSESSYRRARKLLRETIMSFGLPDELLKTVRLREKLIAEFILNTTSIQQIVSKSNLKDLTIVDELSDTLDRLRHWFDSRNEYHKLYMQYIRKYNGAFNPIQADDLQKLKICFDEASEFLTEKHPDFDLKY
ncbi:MULTISPECIES: hypothetical protein [Vibrio]|nr:hypothetical protein [Vibrio tasmaniensis]TKG32638.1 hypothetical protein FC057_12545 [Vibrio tasmaniensis]TKG41678.1 hypothetical protein FC063_07395 [Vibrio tasmaniensis]TKG52033.1 hypothetical protein FC070_09665 [Vibrio tasmaniensis]TKG54008.1 hypothetical protein FC060_00185 [Vibrio tasmaniensis]TKG54847.1 hypothetical protein FC061_06505 [Vibrio tasmaniensis]